MYSYDRNYGKMSTLTIEYQYKNKVIATLFQWWMTCSRADHQQTIGNTSHSLLLKTDNTLIISPLSKIQFFPGITTISLFKEKHYYSGITAISFGITTISCVPAFTFESFADVYAGSIAEKFAWTEIMYSRHILQTVWASMEDASSIRVDCKCIYDFNTSLNG